VEGGLLICATVLRVPTHHVCSVRFSCRPHRRSTPPRGFVPVRRSDTGRRESRAVEDAAQLWAAGRGIGRPAHQPPGNLDEPFGRDTPPRVVSKGPSADFIRSDFWSSAALGWGRVLDACAELRAIWTRAALHRRRGVTSRSFYRAGAVSVPRINHFARNADRGRPFNGTCLGNALGFGMWAAACFPSFLLRGRAPYRRHHRQRQLRHQAEYPE